jgi:D-serine deaminase-like pyridoxal phosphate-dependent protein
MIATDVSDASAALIGRPVSELVTPCLTLDLDIFERNAAAISGYLRDHGVAWRPHAKGHKSPILAQRQLEAGAIGLTVAKVGEAEVMVAGGVPSILVVTEQATRERLDRVAALNRGAEVIVPVDNALHVQLAAEAGRDAGVEIPVVIEVDIGMHRCGVAPEAALGLAMQAAALAGVRFAGVFGYEGHLLRAWPEDEKERQIREALGLLVGAAETIRGAGIEVPIVTAGGTGSYRYSAKVTGITELEAGGGCLMDLMYRDDCHVGPETGLDFALTVRAMVVSRPAPDRAITDAGWKTMSNAHHVPEVKDVPGASVRSLSAEHGTLDLTPEGDANLRIGDVVEFIPGYHDSTVFLHDRIFGVRQGVVTEVIPVAARGRLS